MSWARQSMGFGVLLAALVSCGPKSGHDGGTGTSSGEGEAGSETGSGESGSSGSSETGEEICDIPGPDGSCSIWCQDCPSGEKCVPIAPNVAVFDATRCVEIAEQPKGVGAECDADWKTGIDDCDEGLTCWQVDPEAEHGQCVPLCSGTPEVPVCPGASRCLHGGGWLEVAVCLGTCDPRVGASCDGSLACLAFDPGCGPPSCFPMKNESSLFCLPQTANTVGDGLPCVGGDCGSGLFCAPAGMVTDCSGDAGCCTPYCDLESPSCSAGSCQPVFEPGAEPDGLEHLGACLL